MLHECLDPLGRPSQPVLLYSYINSSCETGIKSPIDAAILQSSQMDVQTYRKVRETPFDFERRRLYVIVTHENETILIAKGAPESVLDVCAQYEENGGRVQAAACRGQRAV